MSEELLPCPCGGTPEIRLYYMDHKNPFINYGCYGCSACGMHFGGFYRITNFIQGGCKMCYIFNDSWINDKAKAIWNNGVRNLTSNYKQYFVDIARVEMALAILQTWSIDLNMLAKHKGKLPSLELIAKRLHSLAEYIKTGDKTLNLGEFEDEREE